VPNIPVSCKKSSWHKLAAFVEISHSSKKPSSQGFSYFQIDNIDLSIVSQLNPYMYKCNLPTSVKQSGSRTICILEVKLSNGADPLSKNTLKAISGIFNSMWKRATGNMSNNGGRPLFFTTVNDANIGVRFLTQLSADKFKFKDFNNDSLPRTTRVNRTESNCNCNVSLTA